MLPLLAALAIVQPATAKATLVSEVSVVQPGVPFVAGVLIQTEPEWHVYWKNPGDSGVPTSVEWKLPADWKVEPLEFPTPKSFESGGIVGYGYEGDVLLLSRITPSKSAKAAPLKAAVRWLACKEACVVGSADLALSLPVAAKPKPSATWAEKLKEALAGLPKRDSGWSAKATKTADGYVLTAKLPPGVLVKGDPEFWPFDAAVIAHEVPQVVTRGEGTVSLKMKKNAFAAVTPKTLKGLLVAPHGKRWPNGLDAIVIEAPIESGG